ncbi:hypothetical protein [Oscillatoria acuminata]|uniref:Uncharacterized protein n=1 Tax=Oscillatoria acuminata PCC 6304 TaxID=56110 RepID=K9TCB0_9CYAN|nr:hypothetical protein [Oscillatoria acuminata]AFY80522.1 hypothetical protein Oscil6304_0786 [Oscillatoria acuminata PCC 6304]
MSDRPQPIGPKLSHRLPSMQLILVGGILLGITPLAHALPPASDIPEEILRTEIITQGRSPIDGTALTPDEYAALLEDPTVRQMIPAENGSGATAIGPIPPGQIMINRLPVRELLRVIFPF